MKKILLFYLLILFNQSVKAQYVTIPDTNFVNSLIMQGFGSCIVGNQLDTTCNSVVNAYSIDCSPQVTSIDGIQYFDNLHNLQCEGTQVSYINSLPPRLRKLYCKENQLTGIAYLPDSLEFLDCSDNLLTSLPVLPGTLKTLDCSLNQLTALSVIPAGLESLIYMYNQISIFPNLPNTLRVLYCAGNGILNIPALPDSLRTFYCGVNNLTSIPALPMFLEEFYCEDNQLTSLPVLNGGLITLGCDQNQLTTLPPIPASLINLTCTDNLLINLPDLPDSLLNLFIYNNPTLSCLPPIKRIGWSGNGEFLWDNTGIQCFPNVLIAEYAHPQIGTFPVCDFINFNGCEIGWNIKGELFNDVDTDCILDSNEIRLRYVKLNLFKNGTLDQQTLTNTTGVYTFMADSGNYSWSVDTNNYNFNVICPVGGSYSGWVIPSMAPLSGKDFALNCAGGFDVGVLSSVLVSGDPVPGFGISFQISAGDLYSFSGLNCASGVSGTVKIRVDGPVTFVTSAGTNLPSFSGDTLIFTISDFSSVDPFHDFILDYLVDTTAQLGDDICVEVWVNPVTGDFHPWNNYFMTCDLVKSSFDPNYKQVYPSGLVDTAQYWLTYTVRLQNTGTSPAIHVRIADTLDNNIDESTFQLLAYSHEPMTQILGNILNFSFPNINLPDSSSNEPASHGFVQYKVRRKPGLPIGAQIQNTAYIYFDFNSPVVTNTTVNTIGITTNVEEPYQWKDREISLYPNPAISGQPLMVTLNPDFDKHIQLQLLDAQGRIINQMESSVIGGHVSFMLPQISSGFYLLVLNDGSGVYQQRLVVK